MKLENLQTRFHPLQQGTDNRYKITAKKVNAAEAKIDGAQEERTDSKNMRAMTEQLNEFAKPLRTKLKFEFHEKLDDYYVTVINKDTDEVIKEIPPKKMLDMYAAMAEFVGILTDEKV
ncbi:flagellar protein FlaG [Lentibacillus lipolyticus]|nr:flagellar protein FlaG [Lentibacillus lipolyticus]